MGTLQSVIDDQTKQSSICDQHESCNHLNSITKLHLILENWIRSTRLRIPYQIFPIALFSSIIQFIHQNTFDIDLLAHHHAMFTTSEQNQIVDDNNQSRVQHFKIAIIGNSNVGKTAITQRWLHGDINFDDRYSCGYYSKKEIKINNDNNNRHFICLWDTRGDPKFRSLTKIYARNASAIIFVYDINDKHTFNGLSQLIEQVDEANDCPQNVMKVLIANKCDLIMDNEEDGIVFKRRLNVEERDLAIKYDISKVYHISAMEDDRKVLDDIFIDITRMILQHQHLCLKRQKYPFWD